MAAEGGSGRSTVAGLLAAHLAVAAPRGGSVLLDTVPRLVSPWPPRAAACASGAPESGGAGGLFSLPPDRPASQDAVRRAAVLLPGGPPEGSADGRDCWLLTDTREWHAPPLRLPKEPAAWYQLAVTGDWPAVVADTGHPVTHDLVASRHRARTSLTRGWCDLPFSVAVLCANATAQGAHAVQQAVMALRSEGLPTVRTVVVFTATDKGRLPSAVRAAATVLTALTAAVVHIPHDPAIRAYGPHIPGRSLSSRTVEAAAGLMHAVFQTALATWGAPLPDAPRPAPLQPPPPPPSAPPAAGPRAVPAPAPAAPDLEYR